VANAAGRLGTPLPVIPGVDFAGVVVSDGDHKGQRNAELRGMAQCLNR
ncbi:NADPH:quinone reductase-like Zn-dependent oxidoreductase, partial [Catenulispora sp. MAP12-49]